LRLAIGLTPASSPVASASGTLCTPSTGELKTPFLVSAPVSDLKSAPIVDITATRTVAELGGGVCAQGLRLVIAHDLGQVRDVVAKSDLAANIDGVYPTVAAAVAACGAPTG
jgi:hypothetical protein